jgi:hypothetical protein
MKLTAPAASLTKAKTGLLITALMRTIAGKYRGRILISLKGRALRPTSERFR